MNRLLLCLLLGTSLLFTEDVAVSAAASVYALTCTSITVSEAPSSSFEVCTTGSFYSPSPAMSVDENGDFVTNYVGGWSYFYEFYETLDEDSLMDLLVSIEREDDNTCTVGISDVGCASCTYCGNDQYSADCTNIMFGRNVSCEHAEPVYYPLRVSPQQYIGQEPVAGDFCDDAVPIVELGQSLDGDTRSAMMDAVPRCDNVTDAFYPGVWFSIQGTGGTLYATTCDGTGTFMDTQLSVYDSCSSLSCVVANDDDYYCYFGQSFVAWESNIDVEYYIFVYGFSGTGEFKLLVDEEIPTLPNDECDSASFMWPGLWVSGVSSRATIADVAHCGYRTLTGIAGLWYFVIGTGNLFDATACFFPSHDTQLSVYTGSCGNLDCVMDGIYMPCGEIGPESSFIWRSEPLITYYIFVSGFDDSEVEFQMALLEVLPFRDVPINDDCTDAVALSLNEPLFGYTISATDDGMDGCGGSYFTGSPGVWFSVVGTGGLLTVSTCDNEDGSGFGSYDTQLTVFSGSCSNPVCIDGNDDGCGLQSAVSWDSTLGVDYLILVHGYYDSVGDFNITFNEGGLPVANDLCSNVEDVWPHAYVYGSITTATIDSVTPCDGAIRTGVWYRVGGTGSLFRVSPCLSIGSVSVSVYTGTCSDLACVEGDYEACTRNDGESEFSWTSDEFVEYYIFVAGDGDFVVEISEEQRPANDQCNDAEFLSLYEDYYFGMIGYSYGNTASATVDVVDETGCIAVTAPGIWYSVEGTGNVMEARTCVYASFDTKLSVFSGGCDSLTCVGSNDDSCGVSGILSAVTWSSNVEVYHILVHGYEDITGDFQLQVGDTPPPPENDECTGASGVWMYTSSFGYMLGLEYGSTEWATMDEVSGCTPAVTSPGVWYTARGTGNIMRARTYSSIYDDLTSDTKLSIFSGTCSNLVCVDGNDDSVDHLSSVTWQSSFASYYILVHGIGNSTGDFNLEVVDVPPNFGNANDICTDATALVMNNVTRGSTLLATFDDVEGNGRCEHEAPGVWYVVTGTGGPLTIETCTDYDIKISVYTGNCNILNCYTDYIINDNENFADFCSWPYSSITWPSELGTTYFVLVHGYYKFSIGAFDIQLKAPDVNDDCTDAIRLNLTESAYRVGLSGSTYFASVDDVSQCTAPGQSGNTPSQSGATPGQGLPENPGTSPGVWYVVTGTGGILRADTCSYIEYGDSDGYNDYYWNDDDAVVEYDNRGESLDTKVSVFTGGCGNLDCVFFGGDCAASWQSESNVDYYILVEGMDSTTRGNFQILMTQPPPNGNCADATHLFSTGIPVSGSTVFSPQSDAPICASANGMRGLWYSIVGTGSTMTAGTCSNYYSETFDTQLSLYEGSCDTLRCVDGNDDACDLQSEIVWNSVENTLYYIFVHGYGSSTGVFDLSVEESKYEVVPASDDCINAVPMELDIAIYSSTYFTKADDVESCGVATPGTAGGVWYKVVGTGGSMTATTCGSFFDTQLSVYSGSCSSLICVADNDDNEECGLSSAVEWVSAPGTMYFVLVHGYSDHTGQFRFLVQSSSQGLNINPSSVVQRSFSIPKNSMCPDAFNIDLGVVHQGSTRSARSKMVIGCGGASESTSPGVWHSFRGTGSTMSITTCDSSTNFNTQISVFSGDCSNLVCIDGDDDSCGFQSDVRLDSELDMHYMVFVHGRGDETGEFGLKVQNVETHVDKEAGGGGDQGGEEQMKSTGDNVVTGGTNNSLAHSSCYGGVSLIFVAVVNFVLLFW